jgi:LuxR family maltose regulon positive regulatory protein
MVPPGWVSRHRAILVIRDGRDLNGRGDSFRSWCRAKIGVMVPAGGSDAAAGRVAHPGAAGVVSRIGLFERLGTSARVTVISAPPGSGKSVLLRSWIGEAGLKDSAGWVSAGRDDHDPQRFWLSVLGALRQTSAGSRLVRELTAAPDLDGWAVVERLLKDLAPLQERIWLVLDDVHELGSADAQRQLELLLMRGPSELRFVLATRHDLRLGLHRLRLEGELTEIRAAHLRFSLAEARELFAAAGVGMPDAALGMLHERTEGWAAGLRLAALSLAGHPDPERFAAEFSGSERTVADYLLAEVLERQSEEVRRLLLRTSILERVNGELADLLTGDEGGEGVLQELEEANAFVLALDVARSWFRYHRLFADLLQLELRRSAPGEIAALHHTAAQWYAGHGYPMEAIRHAQAVQDWGLAVRLLGDHWPGLQLDGQAATVHAMLAGFPAEARAADAELAALAAADELAQGSLEAAERYLGLAARGLEGVEGSASAPPLRPFRAGRRGQLQVLLGVVRLLVARQHGDLPAVADQAQRLQAIAEAPDAAQHGLGEELRALALINLGTTEVWTARFEEAQRHLEQGRALALQIGRPFLEFSGLAHQAAIEGFRSSYSLAEERSLEAVELARRHGWTDEPAAGIAYVVLAIVLAWRGRLDEAEPWIQRAGRTVRPEADPTAGLLVCYARGLLDLARGHHADALVAFRAAEPLAGLLAAPQLLLGRVRALRLQAMVRLGETEGAERALAELGEQQRERGQIRIATAVLRLAQDHPHAAISALAPVLDGSAPVTRSTWLAQAFMLEATARDALGDPAAAGRALERALDLAEPDGTLSAFLLYPAPGLLERHARHSTRHAALISEILDVLPRATGPGGMGGGQPPMSRGGLGGIVPPRLTEPLSQGEIRVLRYLPTNLSAPEIARELSLSVHTVRTHVRHLFAKLGAHGRTEAVARARALGLLAPSPSAAPGTSR